MVAAFDNALAERLAGKIIDSTDAHTVMEMLGLERMDLVAEGVARAFRDWPKFDPAKSQPQTFMHPRINAGIFDYLRKEGSQDRRVKGLGGQTPKADKDRELADWLKGVYEAAKQKYVDSKWRARRTYPMPQTVAIAALMEEKKLSYRACLRFLSIREDLREIIKLKNLPTHTTLMRATAIIGCGWTANPDAPKTRHNECADAPAFA